MEFGRQRLAVGHGEPDAQQMPLCIGIRVVLVGLAAVVQHVIIDQEEVAGLEKKLMVKHRVVGDFVDQIQCLPLGLREGRDAIELQGVFDIGP